MTRWEGTVIRKCASDVKDFDFWGELLLETAVQKQGFGRLSRSEISQIGLCWPLLFKSGIGKYR